MTLPLRLAPCGRRFGPSDHRQRLDIREGMVTVLLRFPRSAWTPRSIVAPAWRP